MCGKVTEILPHDAHTPKEKCVVTISYHNVITERLVTGVFHLINKTPIDCHSKKQTTVEKGTCGFE